MKKLVSVCLLMLVASMIFSGIPISAEAQKNPNILLKLALQAQREVKQQISSDSSDEIKRLFEQASRQVILLEQSLEKDDISSAKQYFLNAMNIFKRITSMLSDRPTDRLESQDITASSVPQRDYNSDLERIKKFIATLKSIARSQSVNFDEVDRLVTQAEKQSQENDDIGFQATLEQLSSILQDIQKELRKHTSQTAFDRTIKFFSDMLDRLEKRGADKILLSDARQMLSDLELLIADRNYDEAKQLKDELTQKIRELYTSIN
jgi:flagellin-specific chaperone FliS